MSHVRPRGEALRSFILENVEAHPSDIAKIAADKFGISRQAINKHLRNLVNEKTLIEAGSTRNKSFKLCPQLEWTEWYSPSGLEEDVVVAPGESECRVSRRERGQIRFRIGAKFEKFINGAV